MSETGIREEICRFGRSLFERGLTPGSSGNISVKLDDGGWLVTPTNASLGFLDPARMSQLGPDGRLVSGDAPTKEVPLHTALYQTRGAARAVVHLHSTHSVALSMLPEIDPRAVLPPMTPYYLMKCGQTALLPYYRPGDPAVADAIKGLAGKYSSVLLANHDDLHAENHVRRTARIRRPRCADLLPRSSLTAGQSWARSGSPNIYVPTTPLVDLGPTRPEPSPFVLLTPIA